MRKITSVLIYTLSSFLVFSVVMIFLNSAQKTIGLHTFRQTGDVDLLLSVLFFGGLSFGFLTKFILGFEENYEPTYLDHFRYSSIFYLIVFVFLVNFFVGDGSLLGRGLEEALKLVFLVVVVVGIAVNFIVLFLFKKKQIIKIEEEKHVLQ